jgi:tetratricopeptide (TPR) repeat protein
MSPPRSSCLLYSERVTVPEPRLSLYIGDGREHARLARLEADRLAARHGCALVAAAAPPEHWPFLRTFIPALPAGPAIVFVEHLERALTWRQTANTRLVTTQAQYLFTEWEAAIAAHGNAWVVATARRQPLLEHAEEVLQRRGVFSRMSIHIDEPEAQADARPDEPATPPERPTTQAGLLAGAFTSTSPEERLHAAIDALSLGRSAGALVATASVCQEVNDLDSAARDLDEAIALAPDWAAPFFERGKVWLCLDNMEDAARAFQSAAERLPAFGSAWGNLGATLGELDRTAEALAAFQRLLALDPDNPQAVNNIGVVTRELGRLQESEASFRRVTELEPNLAFGHYNLGHTLFLEGRYHAAASAYAQGQARDPERNPVQASRLAMCLVATGDPRGALAELQRAAGAMPREYRKQLFSDTSAILWALVTHKPDLTGWQPVHDWLRNEMAALARQGGA